MDVIVGLWRRLSAEELMLLNCGVGEDSWESLGLQGDPTSRKDWCWGWNSNTLATWCEELTHLKRPWCWEGLGAGGEGDDRGWDGWMASPTQWTWVWVDSGSWWWSGRPGVLWFMGLQSRTQLSDWTELNCFSNNDLFGCLHFKDTVRSIFPRVREGTVGFIWDGTQGYICPYQKSKIIIITFFLCLTVG